MKISLGTIETSSSAKEHKDAVLKLELDNKYTSIFNGNFSKTVNSLILKAIEDKMDWLFVCQDCLIPLQTVFMKYIEMSEIYGFQTMFYGFHDRNRAMSKPNPAVIVRVTDDREENLIRQISNCFICFKIDDKTEMFDEDFSIIGYDELLWRYYTKNKIPFFGFFFDVFESWKMFNIAKDASQIIGNEKVFRNDLEIIKKKSINISSSLDVDKVMEWLKDKWK